MLNLIVAMGRLVRDPEVRMTEAGAAVTSWTLAVERDYPGQDGNRETDFIDCVAWKKTAEFVCKYFSKGNMMAVKGRLQIRRWTDKDGNKRRTAEIVADNVYFAGLKKDSGSGNSRTEYPDVGKGLYTGADYGGGFSVPGAIIPDDGDYPLLTDDDSSLPY